MVLRKDMLVWFRNFSVGALDSIKVLYDKSKADNKGEKLHQKTYTPRCCSTMNDNEANVRIYLCISHIDLNLS